MTDVDIRIAPPRARQRFWGHVDVGHPLGCWMWTGSLAAHGYGKASIQGFQQPAHRVAYQLLIGELDSSITLDHLCRNRACVNPDHLEPVSRGENVLRGEGPTAKNARKTHCIRGHEFTPENTLWERRGTRQCRICRRAAARRSARKRGVRPKGRKTHCQRGHEFTPENTYMRPKGRECRTCKSDRRAQHLTV